MAKVVMIARRTQTQPRWSVVGSKQRLSGNTVSIYDTRYPGSTEPVWVATLRCNAIGAYDLVTINDQLALSPKLTQFSSPRACGAYLQTLIDRVPKVSMAYVRQNERVATAQERAATRTSVQHVNDETQGKLATYRNRTGEHDSSQGKRIKPHADIDFRDDPMRTIDAVYALHA